MSVFKDSGLKSVYESSDVVSIMESASETYKGIEVLEEGVMNYTPSMVPVHARRTSVGVKYIIEMDMLQKLSCYSGMGILEAFEAVCEENDVSRDDAFVVMDDPEESLDQKCCASIAAEPEEAISIDNEIQNEYADIRELKEAGINIIINEGFVANMKANPELKKMWKDCKSSSASDDDSEKAQAKCVKSMYSKAESIEDYKFVRSKAAKIDPDTVAKCEKKIKDLKDEKYQMKQDSKAYRRDQLNARREAKRQARADRRAAKAATSEC